MTIYPTIIVALVGSVCLSSVASAAESTTCAASYEKAQEEKTVGHLKAALVHLKTCVDATCPKFMRDDCVRWMDQVESALPTVVFAARRNGEDLTEVEVSCDGEPLINSLDGKAVPLDPGPHTFSFKAPGLAFVQRQTVVREGEQNRLIDIEIAVSTLTTNAQVSSSPAPTQRGRIMRVLPYGLAGVGALGAAGFALFGITGYNQKKDLERTCAPHCESSQVNSVKTKYVLADTCLAVGLVSAGVATYLFLTGRSQDAARRDQTTSVSFVPRLSGAGGVLQIATPF